MSIDCYTSTNVPVEPCTELMDCNMSVATAVFTDSNGSVVTELRECESYTLTMTWVNCEGQWYDPVSNNVAVNGLVSPQAQIAFVSQNSQGQNTYTVTPFDVTQATTAQFTFGHEGNATWAAQECGFSFPIVPCVQVCTELLDCQLSAETIEITNSAGQVVTEMNDCEDYTLTMTWVNCNGEFYDPVANGVSVNGLSSTLAGVTFVSQDPVTRQNTFTISPNTVSQTTSATFTFGHEGNATWAAQECSFQIAIVPCDVQPSKTGFPATEPLNTFDPSFNPPSLPNPGTLGQTVTLSNGVLATCIAENKYAPNSTDMAFNADGTAFVLNDGSIWSCETYQQVGNAGTGYSANNWSTIDPCIMYRVSSGILQYYNWCTGAQQPVLIDGNTFSTSGFGAKSTLAQNDNCAAMYQGSNIVILDLNGTTGTVSGTINANSFPGENGVRVSPDGQWYMVRYTDGYRLYNKQGQDLGWMPTFDQTSISHADWMECDGRQLYIMHQPKDAVMYDPAQDKWYIADEFSDDNWTGNGHVSGLACDRPGCHAYYSNDDFNKIYSVEFIEVVPNVTVTSDLYNGEQVTGCKMDFIVTEWASYTPPDDTVPAGRVTVNKDGTAMLVNTEGANGQNYVCKLECA